MSWSPWLTGAEEGRVPAGSSPPLARSLSSLWKESLNPALFVSLLLESALVSMETGFGPPGGKSHPAVTAQIFLCLVHL